MSRTVLNIFGLLSLALIAAEKTATFAGTWMLDPTKSSPSKLIVMKVAQKGDCVTVVEISGAEHGKTVLKWDYALNGREPSAGTAILFQDALRREKWTLSRSGRELV